MTGKTICPLCQSEHTDCILHLASIPTSNTIVCTDRLTAETWPRGSLRLSQCHRCGFLFNADFDPLLVEYSARNEEAQGFSHHFLRYARSLAREWIQRYGIRNQTVLEVGCGKAEFLAILCEMGANIGIGYDPAVQVGRLDREVGRGLTLIADVFDERAMDVAADVLVCRHTLEHIGDVSGFLRTLHRWAVERAEPPILCFEVPAVERVLEEIAFWDLFYEHCSYFTIDTLKFAFERAGFDVLDIRRAYDDQYLIVEARPSTDAPASVSADRHGVATAVALARSFATRYQSAAANCRQNLERLAGSDKPVVLWGAGSKAVSFLTSLTVDDLVAFTVDINPHKQSTYLVGTSRQVVGPDQLRGAGPMHVVVMNPAYLTEVAETLRGIGANAFVHSVTDLVLAPPPDGATSRHSRKGGNGYE